MYVKTKDPALREKLIMEYLSVVKIVAGRLAVRFNGHVEFEDMVSYGVFGLIDAIDKFDFKKGVKFETYASVRIKGAIIDSIRKLDWVPRTTRQDSKRLETAFLELEGILGREPRDVEIAEKLGITLEETREMIRKATLSSFVSLDDFQDQNHEGSSILLQHKGDGRTPEDELIRQEAREMLAGAIEKLTEKERLVTTLYYYEELTLKEISKIMGVTESRVSQIHSKAVFKLRIRLGKYATNFDY